MHSIERGHMSGIPTQDNQEQNTKSKKRDYQLFLTFKLCFAFWHEVRRKLFFMYFLGQFCAGRRGKLQSCEVIFLFVFACSCLSNILICLMHQLADSATLFPITFTNFVGSFEVSLYFHFLILCRIVELHLLMELDQMSWKHPNKQ